MLKNTANICIKGKTSTDADCGLGAIYAVSED